MYIKNTGGRNTFEHQPYSVIKTGWISKTGVRKSAEIDSIFSQGFDYYQVNSSQGACSKCESHNGAIYPVSNAQNGENLPPFHPNCQCRIQGFESKNATHDPWLSEILVWLGILYDDNQMEEKARNVLDFYQWTEFSIEFISNILSAIADIEHIGNRMKEFFRLLTSETPEEKQPSKKEDSFRLPSVHFEGKPHPLSPVAVTLPAEWTDYVQTVGGILDIDHYLIIAFILHESGGKPSALNTMYSDPMQQASGLMQIIPRWHSAYQSGGQYYNNYADIIAYAKRHGADIDDLFDPLGNITIGMMMLNEQRKLCKDPADMQEWVGRQGEGYHSPSTIEILYYRDQLAIQNGIEPWYSERFYSSRMAK